MKKEIGSVLICWKVCSPGWITLTPLWRVTSCCWCGSPSTFLNCFVSSARQDSCAAPWAPFPAPRPRICVQEERLNMGLSSQGPVFCCLFVSCLKTVVHIMFHFLRFALFYSGRTSSIPIHSQKQKYELCLFSPPPLQLLLKVFSFLRSQTIYFLYIIVFVRQILLFWKQDIQKDLTSASTLLLCPPLGQATSRNQTST